MAKRKSSFDKRIVVAGVLVALSVIILYLGCAIEVLDLTMSAIVSLLVVVIVIEMGYNYAWLSYVATSILSIVLLPQKTPAIFYMCFMGFYPIIKSYIERIGSAVIRWIIKLVIGNAAIGAMFLLMSYFVPDEFEGEGLVIVTYVLALLAFVMYDIALTKLITMYFRMIRERIKIYKFLR
jgi:hypothetical protein